MLSRTLRVGSALLLLCVALSQVPLHTAETQQTPIERPQPPTLMVIFYLWYGYNETTGTFTGGNGTSHWNDAPERTFLGRPVSYYSSMDNATLAWQLQTMQRNGISALMVSWWGPSDYTNNATLNLFKYIRANGIVMKIALMVEPYEGLNESATMDYLYSSYYMPYSDLIFQWEGKPLLAWFRSTPLPSDPRFTMRVISNCADCEHWHYVQGIAKAFESSDKSASEIACYSSLRMSNDSVATVTPRFDNYYEWQIGGRRDYMRYDVNYTHNMLAVELAWAYQQNATLIIITSYNEYTEGSMIEPHYDPYGQFINITLSVPEVLTQPL